VAGQQVGHPSSMPDLMINGHLAGT
jgi:hypothetical protein